MSSGTSKTCSASSTQVTLSRRIRSRKRGNVNVDAIPVGTATPLASSTMYSGRSGMSSTDITASIRSSRIEQQTQPFARLTTPDRTPTTRSASMFTSPKSLTRTATRSPWSPSSIRFSRVVLPAPRKPVSTVTGTGGGAPSAAAWSRTSRPGGGGKASLNIRLLRLRRSDARSGSEDLRLGRRELFVGHVTRRMQLRAVFDLVGRVRGRRRILRLLLVVVSRRLVVGLLLLRVVLVRVVSHCRPGNDCPAPCPSPESHGELLPVRSAVLEGG